MDRREMLKTVGLTVVGAAVVGASLPIAQAEDVPPSRRYDNYIVQYIPEIGEWRRVKAIRTHGQAISASDPVALVRLLNHNIGKNYQNFEQIPVWSD